MKGSPAKHAICDHGEKSRIENLYRLGIQEILKQEGWKKLNIDSLWYHETYGTCHSLFALYLSHLAIKKQRLFDSWPVVCFYVLFGIITGLTISYFI